MAVSLLNRGHQSWMVDCCMDYRYNPSALRITSSLDAQANPAALTVDMTKERIKKLLSNVELSVSSYDTAWVAMVPSPNTPNSPCFPKCLNWVMDNQLNDGSWGALLLHQHPPLLKDSLSSTLASILALKRWNLGEHQINKGLCFIESNFASATDKNQPSPIGFDIIFPGMLEYAQELNIRLPLNQTNLSVMLHQRELELRRCYLKEKEAYLVYISEGLGNYHDWNMVKKYQMKNGSLFNSPSATAAALIHHQNAGCLDYLTSLVNKFGNAVPTVYPHDLYVRLHMVDTLERLGIARHFRVEIQNILDETYRYWVQRDEQIFIDVVTCSLAFRVLRTNGYQVSSDPLTEITKSGDYMNSVEEPFKDIYAALEVYRASHIMNQEELSFGEDNLRSIDFLKQKMATSSIPSNWLNNLIHKQVDIALMFPFIASSERISTRRNIEHYNVEDPRILKTTYCSLNINNEDYLRLAVEDFNACQSVYRKELKGLERWVVENRLDKLKFARQKTSYCYFSAASTLSSPELSDARISYAKNGILVALVDDLFDVGGSMEELLNLIQSVEKWNVNVDDDCCSEEVRIIFLALKDAVYWIGERALKRQARNITSHLIEIWLDLLKSMLREAIWTRHGAVPTINEYMENGYVSFALGPVVLPVLYFLCPRLSEDIVRSSEYHYLFKLVSTEGRLLNDIQSFKRELKAGKLNAVTLHTKCGLEEEKVIKEIKDLINNQRRELMRLVLQAKGSIVPKACKDIFWNTSNVLNLFYGTNDGFTGNDILDIVQEIIYEPVSHRLMI